MDNLRFSYVDYIVFSITFGLTCAMGIILRFEKSSKNCIKCESKIKIVPVSLCLVASTLSGVSLLGVPSEVYMHGMQISMMVISIVIMGIINNYIYLPVFYLLQLRNPFDYFEIRFGYGIKKMAIVFNMVCVLLSLPLIIYVPSLALSQVSGYNLHVTSLIMLLICIFYATIVQLKTTEWLSYLQLAITIVILGLVLVMGTVSLGGITTIWETSRKGNRIELFNMDPNPTSRCTFWSVIIGNTFSWLGFVAVHPSGVQRITSFQAMGDAKKALLIFVILASATKLISCFFGLIIFTRYFNCDPLSLGYMQLANEIVPFYVLEVALKFPGLSGLFIAGLFSTALNNLSTSLSATASEIYEDLVNSLVPKNVSKKVIQPLTTFFIIVLSVLATASITVVERLGSVLELFQCAYGITGGPILGLFTLGMLFPLANKKGALFGGIISSLIMAVIIGKHLIEIWNGEIIYENKELSTDGCELQVFIFSNSTPISVPETDLFFDSFPLSKISFHYYYMIGTILTVVIGLVISWFTKTKACEVKNIYVFSPCIQKLSSFQYMPI